jgi:large subunit ribosomal protein L24e
MKIETCNFSGYKIYPSRGRLVVRSDSRIYRFLNGKCESLFLQRKKPSKISWTLVSRRMRKKGQQEENAKKQKKRVIKVQRAVVGASLDAIKARREANPTIRAQERKQAVEKIKEQKKVAKEKRVAGKVINFYTGP